MGTADTIGDRDSSPQPGGAACWPQDGFDSKNTAYNPAIGLIESPTEDRQIASNSVFPDWGSIEPGIAVVNDRVYFPLDAGIAAYSTAGRELWSLSFDYPTMFSTPALSRDVLYVTAGTGLYGTQAVANDSGDVLWTGDVVYGSGSGTVVAVTADESRWKRDDLNGATSKPVVTDELVVVADSTALYAMDRATGEPQWLYTHDDRYAIAPAVTDDHVYFPAGNRSHSLCLALETGAEQWRVETGGLHNQPTAVADGVYFTGHSGITAVDADGTRQWGYTAQSAYGTLVAVKQGLVFADSDGAIRLLQA